MTTQGLGYVMTYSHVFVASLCSLRISVLLVAIYGPNPIAYDATIELVLEVSCIHLLFRNRHRNKMNCVNNYLLKIEIQDAANFCMGLVKFSNFI